MKKEDLKTYVLIGVSALTLINTMLILTMDTGPELGSPNTVAKNTSVSGANTAPVNGGQISTTLNNANQVAPPVGQNLNTGNTAAPSGPLASVKFEKYEHDFGTVKPLTTNTYKFRFTNTGDVPLTIENARASCGCTVPNWPKEPIMPNQSSEIEVEFTPKETQLGTQEKQITITANTPESNTILKIKANVVE